MDKNLIKVLIISSVFFTCYSFYSIFKFITLNSTGFDLGIYGSVLHSALNGNLFYSNLIGTSFLGNHFSPFLFLILPFFWLFPHNATILIIQAFMITFTAVPLYLIYSSLARERTNNFKALLIIISYEFSAISIGPITFDFHLMALMPFFYAWALYFFIRKKPLKEGISLLLMTSLHASFALFSILFIISTRMMRYGRRGIIESINKNRIKFLKLCIFYTIAIVTLLSYFIIAAKIRDNIGGTPYGDITSTHALFTYLYIRYRITFSLSSLFSSGWNKMKILEIALISGGFYALLSPLLLIPSIPYFLFAFFSANTAYFSFGYQYTAMVSPMIFTAAMVGLARTSAGKSLKRLFSRKGLKQITSLVLISGIVFGAITGPLNPYPLAQQGYNLNSIGNFHYNMTSQTIFSFRNNISSDTCLLTQNNLYPEFDSFQNAYLLYSYTSIGNLSNLCSRNFTYIIADQYSPFYSIKALVGVSMQQLIVREESHNYFVYLEHNGIIILKRS
ncbi:MAG: DUF2079 domain-containing protein [Thermoplasmataceae archaeon]